MTSNRPLTALVAASLLTVSLLLSSGAAAALPAPVPVAPADGSSLRQPITLDWNPVIDPQGEIGNYHWQVGTSSTFTTVILEGFTNQLFPGVSAATKDLVSGLPNGTYFWRVKATSTASGDTPYSVVQTFTVTGLGPAPRKAPVITSPANGASFQPVETFPIRWSAVAGAEYYLLEATDEPTFSYPLTYTTGIPTFGTQFIADLAVVKPTVYYRVRAVSADNVRGLPSRTFTVNITSSAPLPPPPAQVSPAESATVSLPFTFDWTDTPNPQIPGYNVEVNKDPTFSGTSLLIGGIFRSDYLITSNLNPGNYFWRVQALHGSVAGPWSAGRAITVVKPPPTPPGLVPFLLLTSPSFSAGGNPTQSRLTLNAPAPVGGALVTLASDLPEATLAGNVLIPQGQTDALITPVTTTQAIGGGTVGTLRASYGGGTQQSSLGIIPLLLGTQLGVENVVGGSSFNATITLVNPAPTGGAVVRLVSNDTSVVRPPATVTIPAGATGANFSVATSAVSESVIATIDSGTDSDGYRAPRLSVIVTPSGGATLPPSLASVTLSSSSVLGGNSIIGTMTLTGPAPAGGALIPVTGSLEGQVVTPASVTVPAGSTSADFTITTPLVRESHWVVIQAQYGTFDGIQSKVLEIDPGPTGPPTVFAVGVAESEVTAGANVRGTAGLFAPAPAGGAVIRLSSANSAVVQVPANLRISAGNSANSFNITTSSVAIETSVRIDASLGGVTKSVFLNVEPNPNDAPLLQSLSVNPTSVPGGTSATGTATLSAPAPAGGIFVTLATSNSAVAQVPAVVSIAGGQTSANFTVTTFPVSSDTVATITGFYGSGVQSVNLTVTRNSTP